MELGAAVQQAFRLSLGSVIFPREGSVVRWKSLVGLLLL